MTAISLKHHRFIVANERIPIVYYGIEDHRVSFRLQDGSLWTFSRREAAQFPLALNWAYLKEPDRRLTQHRNEELKMLAKVERERLSA
jgi:hypothetical protein